MVFKFSSPLRPRIITFESCGHYQVIVVLDNSKDFIVLGYFYSNIY